VDTFAALLGKLNACVATLPDQTWVTTVGLTIAWDTSVTVATVIGMLPVTTTGREKVSVTLVVPVLVTAHVTP
jgi:hypothetical protein